MRWYGEHLNMGFVLAIAGGVINGDNVSLASGTASGGIWKL